ncbi:MAG: hypothetical protein PHW10_04610 [Candidatus Peribacteraceae bacterium]|nr:hypothetical protein [Candidatus Peribacteraceae bacterium]
MATKAKVSDSYILDTYRASETGKFVPGAVTYCGRKRLETFQWKQRQFPTQGEADSFARGHFAGMPIKELGNEGEMKSKWKT